MAEGPQLTEDARTLWSLLSAGASKNGDAIAYSCALGPSRWSIYVSSAVG